MSPEKKKYKIESEEGSPFEQDNGISPGKQDPLKLPLEDESEAERSDAKFTSTESVKQ